MSHVNWPDLMRAGLVQLRLQPAEFWALTPSELMVMLGQGGSAAPMGRARLADLLRAYPDAPRAQDDLDDLGDLGEERKTRDE